MTTVNMYKNGTVMVQGNLTPFELDFLLIKERAQQEKSAPTDNNPCQRQTPPPLQAALLLTLRRSPPLRELISQQPAQDTRVQQDSSAISTELTKLRQDRDSNRRELSTVRTEVRELQQDRESHMARLTALTEEVRE
ncbi:Disks large like 5 [Dissostichus eleginoides]|uniref:Disks large like 5 n=1 Tax=Dissostichus eleginoides TaxID=100907 RepID=A0AAD9CM69_DISEL|nr:Disks large like 5 [Dissostichus eleginoides]